MSACMPAPPDESEPLSQTLSVKIQQNNIFCYNINTYGAPNITKITHFQPRETCFQPGKTSFSTGKKTILESLLYSPC